MGNNYVILSPGLLPLTKEKIVVSIQFKLVFISCILCGCLISGCSKSELSPTASTVMDLQTELPLRDIEFVNDTLGFICGGIPGETGVIWRTVNSGITWSRVLEEPGRCIYDADFFDGNNGYAGGDALMLLHTTDGGTTWKNEYENADFSNWSEFIKPIRKIAYPNPRTIIAIGGDTWYKGLMCASHNWGQDWFFKDFDNQLNDIAVPDISSVWICGYGLMLLSADSCSNLNTLAINEDNFTALDFSGTAIGLACGYNGGIYKTTDSGLSWKEVLKSNNTFDKRQHFNDICFINNNRAIAVGNNGLLLLSNDQGEHWQTLKIDTENDLLSLTEKSAGEIWLCGTNGFLCQILL